MKINFALDYRHPVLWYFVAFTFGIALYFGAHFEPNLVFLSVLIFSFLAAFYYRRQNVWIKLALCLLMGLTVAGVRTNLIHTQFLKYPLWDKVVSAEVKEAYSTHKGQMVVLERLSIEGAKFVPRQARVSFEAQEPRFKTGDKLTFNGHLYPPHVFQKQRFFYQGYGAAGKITGILNHTPAEETFLDKIRFQVMRRLKELLPQKQAEVAIPLLVGEQSVVSPELYEIYRKAGIAHVLSVSGFHMALLAFFVFFCVRGLVNLSPRLSAHVNAKKAATLIAFSITFFYLLISGTQVPAVRAFLMICLAFIGVLTDRKIISLYNLLVVAFGILLFRPEWVTSISFQLSFISVMILVGVLEEVSERLPHIRFVGACLAAFVANIIITLALMPFVMYHFNQVTLYGVAGNLLTSVFFSFLVMPLLFLSSILMPFGWDAPFIKLTGFLLNEITKMAQTIASWPYAEIIVPSFAPVGLGVVALGLTLLCVLKTKARFVGIVLVFAGLGLGYALYKQPDIVVANQGDTILVRQNGRYLIKGKADSFAAKTYLTQNGQETAEAFTKESVTLNNLKIAFSVSSCDGADLAVLPKKDAACTAKDILVPRYRQTYLIDVEKTYRIRREDKADKNRPWGQF